MHLLLVYSDALATISDALDTLCTWQEVLLNLFFGGTGISMKQAHISRASVIVHWTRIEQCDPKTTGLLVCVPFCQGSNLHCGSVSPALNEVLYLKFIDSD